MTIFYFIIESIMFSICVGLVIWIGVLLPFPSTEHVFLTGLLLLYCDKQINTIIKFVDKYIYE